MDLATAHLRSDSLRVLALVRKHAGIVDVRRRHRAAMGKPALPGTVLHRRFWGRADYGGALLFPSFGKSVPANDWGFWRRLRYSDCLRDAVRGQRNHDDPIPLHHQGEVLCGHSDRGHAGLCHGRRGKRCVCRASRWIACWGSGCEAGAESRAGQSWILRTLLRPAEFLVTMEATAVGKEV